MNLFDTVSEEIKRAMKAREMVRLEALRGIKKEFLEAKTAKGSNGELTDAKAASGKRPHLCRQQPRGVGRQ